VIGDVQKVSPVILSGEVLLIGVLGFFVSLILKVIGVKCHKNVSTLKKFSFLKTTTCM